MKRIATLFLLSSLYVLLLTKTTLAMTIDFNSGIFSYGVQDEPSNQTVTIENNGATLHMIGNAWKYTVTPVSIISSTVLAFDFNSATEGDIHGIAFETVSSINPPTFFQVFGDQTYGIQDFNNYSISDDWRHYEIPVGSYFTGSYSNILFANDHDMSTASGESYFRNVTIGQPVPEPATMWLIGAGLIGISITQIRVRRKK